MRATDEHKAARDAWTAAQQAAIQERRTIFGEGTGFGDPDAKEAALQRLAAAETEAQMCRSEYEDLQRVGMEKEMLQLQRSQRLATWASFAVAAAVGATVIADWLSRQ